MHYITLEKYPIEPRLVEGLGYEALVDASLFAAIHAAPWEQPIAITPHFTLEKRCCDLLAAPLPHDIDIVYFDAFAPYRNLKMFDDILRSCRPQTRLCIAANLTCEDEYAVTRTIAEWKGQRPPIDKIPCMFLIYK